jgi:hypothetical protein
LLTPTQSLPTLESRPALRQRALWLVRAWYWLAPGFVLLWLGFGIDLRFPFLDVLPGSRAALYAMQLGCTVTLAWRPKLAPLVGSLESSLSIGLLIVTTWMAYWGMYIDAATSVANPFTPENVSSLVASAMVLALSRMARAVNPR